MADVNLKQYLARLDKLLEERSYAETIFHCRHILQEFPKNIAVYRRLGQALLGSERWNEAIEVLRRVLSVDPDDRMAHFSLSRAYRHIKPPDDALWHLERVYEQGA